MLPKKLREFPESQHQDRKGEPKRTDVEDRDLAGGEGGDRDASAPKRYFTRRLDWIRASAIKFAYVRSPRRSSRIGAGLFEATLAHQLQLVANQRRVQGGPF